MGSSLLLQFLLLTASCLYLSVCACVCPSTNQHSFIVCSFTVVSLDLSRCAIVSYENSSSFNYFYLVFVPFISFSCQCALMMNTSSTSDGGGGGGGGDTFVFFLSSKESP